MTSSKNHASSSDSSEEEQFDTSNLREISPLRVGSNFSFWAIVIGLTGSFTIGVTFSLLNVAIRPMSIELWPCDYKDIEISESCNLWITTQNSPGSTVNLAECNNGPDYNPTCIFEYDEEIRSCSAPTPTSCKLYSDRAMVLNLMLQVGNFLGSIIYYFLASFDLRTINFLCVALFSLGTICTAFVPNYGVIVFARVLAAMGCGIFFNQACQWISGMSPDSKITRNVSANGLVIGVGTFIMAIFGFGFDSELFSKIEVTDTGYVFEYTKSDKNTWFWKLSVMFCLLPIVINVIGYLYLRASVPEQYYSEGDNEGLYCILQLIHKKEDVKAEYAQYLATKQIAEARNSKKVSPWAALSNPVYLKILTIGCITGFMHTATGIDLFLQSSASIIGTLNFSYKTSVGLASGLTAVMFLCALPNMIVIGRLGTKTCIVIGLTIQMVATVIPAISFMVSPESKATSYIAIAGLYVFFAAFASFYSPFVGAWMQSVFPQEIENFGVSSLMAFVWLGGGLSVAIGMSIETAPMFYVLAIMNIFGFLNAVFLVKGTEGSIRGTGPYIKVPVEDNSSRSSSTHTTRGEQKNASTSSASTEN